jgi:hypothetical protein
MVVSGVRSRVSGFGFQVSVLNLTSCDTVFCLFLFTTEGAENTEKSGYISLCALVVV